MARAVTAERRRYIGGGRTLSSLSAISTLVWQPVFSFCRLDLRTWSWKKGEKEREKGLVGRRVMKGGRELDWESRRRDSFVDGGILGIEVSFLLELGGN